jgi:energy-converting hydrogenase Eha subunit E
MLTDKANFFRQFQAHTLTIKSMLGPWRCGPVVSSLAVEIGAVVDVMISIFCEFRQFSAKKLAFFLKSNVMINCLHNLAVF